MMSSKGALTLIADYGGDSSEDEVPGPGVSVKRLHENDEELGSKKLRRLPLPNIFLDNQVSPHHIDDPSLHNGRIRTFAHERGNWATFVYIPFEENEGIKELLSVIVKLGGSRNLNMKQVDDFHISLTKILILKHHWINLFTSSIKTNIINYKKFMVFFDNLKVYCNEDRTRTFIGLQVRTGYESLLNLTKALDKCLEEFNLAPFYEDPSFHMSVAWCTGDFEEELNSVLPELNSRLCELMNEYSQENWYIYVEYLMCKIGNKYFQFYF